MADDAMMVPLAALQREATRVNGMQGVQAFMIGALHAIARCETLTAAQTCAEMALQNTAEYSAGISEPGPTDDPADWQRR